jgi:7,8-dihydropterin-6-yl-methyl-4-(beta-D-ribofuranosyl)aminobenzene 5'-phosphate synthase
MNLHLLALLTAVAGLAAAPAPAQQSNRITILADAFGTRTGLEHDWGFSALVEYNGHRILFDTGNDSARFARNVAALGIDLRDLDAVVISHRHGDHTDGLHHLRTVNPDVVVFGPNDEYFGGPTPAAFFRRPDSSLPPEQRYFGGRVPAVIPHGTPWRGLNVVRAAGGTEIAAGIRLIENVAPGREFGETPELALVIDTPEGQVVLVGCSHPGIEHILTSLATPSRPVALLVGGLHLLNTSDSEVDRIAARLRSDPGVKRIAPGHCTGEYAFTALRRVFGSAFVHAGVGEVIAF